MGLVSLLFSFRGRINRVQYWLGSIGTGFGGMMLFFLLGVLFLPSGEIPKTSAGVAQMLSTVGLVMGLPLMLISWVGMALQTKRFHDRGRSGLWVLLPMLPVTMIMISVASSVASGAHPEQVASSIGVWVLLLQAINLFMFVDLGCMPGKEGPNKYGAPPGGGLSGGAPAGGPIPGQAAPSKAATAIPGMGLTSAESAIDRAIAARAKQAQAPAAQAPQRAAPRPLGPAPMASMGSAAPGSFGRKATR